MRSSYSTLILSIIFIGSIDSFEVFQPFRAPRTLLSISSQHNYQDRRRWMCTLPSHSVGNLQETDEWVTNPATGRRIKRNGARYNEILHKQGGYILHGSQLVPIEPERLWAWTQDASAQPKKRTITRDVLSVDGANSNDKSDEARWRRVEPEILSSGEANTDDIDMESLPFLDELLFVFKSSSLLTLPGIGDDKQVCLASLVNDWLHIEGNLDVVEKIPSYEDEKKKKKRMKRKKKSKSFVPRPCHRLDYDTSGVMVIGLTRNSLRLTNAMFERKGGIESVSQSINLKKTYIALVAGEVLKDDGFIDYPYVAKDDYYLSLPLRKLTVSTSLLVVLEKFSMIPRATTNLRALATIRSGRKMILWKRVYEMPKRDIKF